MPRAMLVPVVLVAVPLARFVAGLLMVLLVLASVSGLIVAVRTGDARDRAFPAGLPLAVVLLRWLRILLLEAQRTSVGLKASYG